MNRRWCTPTLDSRATTASTTDAVASSKKKRSQTESHAGMTHDYFWCRKNADDVFVCFVFFFLSWYPHRRSRASFIAGDRREKKTNKKTSVPTPGTVGTLVL